MNVLRPFKLYGLLACAALACAQARAALWVSDDGSDSNPGTEERPLATLARARDLVRTLDRDMADDITVFVAGTQRLGAPLEFGPEDSATNGFSIIYTAVPGAHPVVTGALVVQGWSLADRSRNLWSAPEPAGADGGTLYVNGRRADPTMLRLSPPQTGEVPTPPPVWRNPHDVVFAARDAEELWGRHDPALPCLAINLFEQLGKPGEAYVDRRARIVYYTPRPGEDMTRCDTKIATATRLMAIRGDGGRAVRGLVFKAIRFEFADPARDTAAVQADNASELQFLEDTFAHVNGPALALGAQVDGCDVEGCAFGDIASSALSVKRASRIRVSQCRFSYVATVDHAGAAVVVEHAQAVSIEHTQVDHFPASAFLLLEEAPGGCHLRLNRVGEPAIGPDRSPAQDPADPDDRDPAGVSAPYASALAEAFGVPGVPSPPTSVCAEGEDGFAYVSWVPPCEDGGSAVGSYTVACSSGGAVSVSAAQFKARGYVRFADLQDGRRITFSVTAANALGASAPSLPSEPIAPAYRRLRLQKPPTAAFVTDEGPVTRIRLTPAPQAAGPVLAYIVTARPSGARLVLEGRDILASGDGAQIQRLVTGFPLAEGTSVFVSAVNTKGEGQAVQARILR